MSHLRSQLEWNLWSGFFAVETRDGSVEMDQLHESVEPCAFTSWTVDLGCQLAPLTLLLMCTRTLKAQCALDRRQDR